MANAMNDVTMIDEVYRVIEKRATGWASISETVTK